MRKKKKYIINIQGMIEARDLQDAYAELAEYFDGVASGSGAEDIFIDGIALVQVSPIQSENED